MLKIISAQAEQDGVYLVTMQQGEGEAPMFYALYPNDPYGIAPELREMVAYWLTVPGNQVT